MVVRAALRLLQALLAQYVLVLLVDGVRSVDVRLLELRLRLLILWILAI